MALPRGAAAGREPPRRSGPGPGGVDGSEAEPGLVQGRLVVLRLALPDRRPPHAQQGNPRSRSPTGIPSTRRRANPAACHRQPARSHRLHAVAVKLTVDDVSPTTASDLRRDPTCQGRCGALAHPRGLAVGAKPLEHRVCQPDEPRPVRHNDHRGQRPIQLSICVERAQPRGEELRIAAPVRMMRPDELPAAPLSIFHV